MRIMICYLPTAKGRMALEEGMKWAEHSASEVVVARHVGVSDRDEGNIDMSEVRGDLESVADEVRARGLTCRTDWSIGGQSASSGLLSLARQYHVDLIVIGIRRRSRVGKAFLGSNAQDILLQSDVPVLAVKAEKAE